jgi:TonB family protein
MKFSKTKLVGALLVTLSPMCVRAANLRVIANPSVPADSISARELQSVFLGETTVLHDGTRVEPVFEKGGSAHEAFLKDYLHESDDQLQNYFRSLVFSGRGTMPKSVRTDAEVVAYVAKTKGAIGYVSSETNTSGVKSLDILSLESTMRRLVTRVEPEYPELLRKNHIRGTVRLEVIVAANGKVETVTLRGGDAVLGDLAMTAVRKWVYAPAHSKETIEVSIPFDDGVKRTM